ncbi:MAG: DUF2202 domain-containing protein [Microbacteriaceae bacterium]|nr:DUF2202 domain-containing protein [Microbacteriaceae bacterium]
MFSPHHHSPARTAAAMLAGFAAIALLAGCTTTATTGADGASTAAPGGSTAASVDPGAAETAPGERAAEQRSEADELLLYIIEEEKLAHDVYAAMAEIHDRNPFANIMESEIQHQELLVPILAERGLDDPRTGVEGTFTNPEIQALHDEFVAQGEQSWSAAIEVGIAIEEADIRDLEAAIEAETDPAAIAAYERLLAGSENHLEAFQRQQR